MDAYTLARLAPSGLAALATRGTWQRPPHVAAIERKLLDVAAGRCKRLLVVVPVRHGKSQLCSRYFPAWLLGTFPRKRVILASYGAELAEGFSRQARDLLAELGPQVFGVRPRRDVRSADRWELEEHGGGMVAAGVCSGITGKGCDLLLVDDAFRDAAEANSPTQRDRVWDWFSQVAYTRLEPGGAVVVVGARWHEDDLIGRLLEQAKAGGEPWDVVSLPALAEEGDPLGRAEGEPLWPERFDREALESIRRTIGGHAFAALYQGRPVAAGGEVFQRAWFRYFKDPKPGVYELDAGRTVTLDGLRRYQTVDLAASTRASADYTVVATFGVAGDRILVLDVVRGRFPGPELVPTIKRAAERWRPSTVWIEKQGFQLALVDQARHAGLPVRELVRARGEDKRTRALAATPRFEAGQVWFPSNASWLAALEDELLVFDRGKHDDQVDALTDGVLLAPRSVGSRGFAPRTFGGPLHGLTIGAPPDYR